MVPPAKPLPTWKAAKIVMSLLEFCFHPNAAVSAADDTAAAVAVGTKKSPLRPLKASACPARPSGRGCSLICDVPGAVVP